MLRLIKCLCKCLFGGSKWSLDVFIHGFRIKGITMVKFEFGQFATFTASGVDRRGRPAVHEVGTAVWSIVAQDATGNDVSDSFTLMVNPENELEATLTAGDVEATGVLTLRADGDPDVDEEAPVVATADIIVDAPNVVALSLTNTEPADVE